MRFHIRHFYRFSFIYLCYEGMILAILFTRNFPAFTPTLHALPLKKTILWPDRNFSSDIYMSKHKSFYHIFGSCLPMKFVYVSHLADQIAAQGMISKAVLKILHAIHVISRPYDPRRKKNISM